MNEYQIDYRMGNITDNNSVKNWLGNQKNNVKSIDDYTFNEKKQLMGLKKDGYMFYFSVDGTEQEIEFEETSKDYFNFSTNSDGQTAAITGFSELGIQKHDAGEIKTLFIPTKDKNGLTITTINNYSFSGMNKIEELIIPETITTIHGYETFKNCTGIKYLRIPISLWTADNGMYAFTGVTNIEEIYFSKGTGVGANYVDSHSQQTYYQYTPWYLSKANLTKITLEKGITSIGTHMFHGCGNITDTWEELINSREELTNIGAYAFKECSKITGELSFPSKVIVIYNGTFTGDTGITRLIIPETIAKINTWETFKDCTGIKYLKIPISLWGEDENAYTTFNGVTNVEDIYFTKGSGIGMTYVVTSGNKAYYQNTPWYKSREKLTQITLEKGITSIGAYMFFGCSNISNTWEELINSREELTNIGAYAFKECAKITGELILPNNITVIYNGTFTGCIGITGLTIPDTITTINTWETFKNCTGIKYLKIPISLWGADENSYSTFNGVTNVEELYFTKGSGIGMTYVATSGNKAYYQNTPWYISRTKLTKLSLEKGITSIGNYTLNGCNNITQINYTGKQAEWNSVTIGTNNSILTTVAVQCEN